MTLINNKLKESIDNITREPCDRNMGASIDKSNRESIDFHPRHTEQRLDDDRQRQPPHIIDLKPPDLIDQPDATDIDRYPPETIDRHPWLDELPGYTIKMEPIDERVHKFETSHLSVPKHHRPCEAVGIHKRVNRIHDPVKIAVSYFVSEDESPIPPDRSVQPYSYIGPRARRRAVPARLRRAGPRRRCQLHMRSGSAPFASAGPGASADFARCGRVGASLPLIPRRRLRRRCWSSGPLARAGPGCRCWLVCAGHGRRRKHPCPGPERLRADYSTGATFSPQNHLDN
ncbi:hypothetical protein Bca52824_026990 [Brassica carinata]|uniref:Uncharacterized protein n=1 Tax=Brassica carinata TaxID=52824 RepID=A0A8X7SJI0_BRACI|nr:hypothetical protein Bca52824_026990 [Brassica carinata]